MCCKLTKSQDQKFFQKCSCVIFSIVPFFKDFIFVNKYNVIQKFNFHDKCMRIFIVLITSMSKVNSSERWTGSITASRIKSKIIFRWIWGIVKRMCCDFHLYFYLLWLNICNITFGLYFMDSIYITFSIISLSPSLSVSSMFLWETSYHQAEWKFDWFPYGSWSHF